MTKPIVRDPIYRRRRFDAEIIELCVRWYITYRLSYRALSTSLPRWPRKITLDGHVPSHLALRLLRREDPKWKNVEVRSNQYLNNLIEQDHRAIKRRCAAMVGGFKSFRSAAITLAGIELAHRIRKRQFSFGRGRYQNFGSLKQIWNRALA
jgi:transposase-like protein